MKNKAKEIVRLAQEIMQQADKAENYKKTSVILWAANEIKIQAKKIIQNI